MRGVGLRKAIVVAVVAVAAVPTAFAASADPTKMLLAQKDVPGAPYERTETYGQARLRAQLLGLTIGSGANSPASRVARAARCAARYFETDTASGKKQAFSYVCVTGSAADSKVLARALIGKKKEFVRQPARCQAVTPSLGQSSGVFRWCPYNPNSTIWTTSFLGIWSYKTIVAVYGYEYPLISKRPSLQQVLPGLTRLSTRIKAAG